MKIKSEISERDFIKKKEKANEKWEK